ncbi:hypothetical protein [Plantibacter sp. YIM 135347]|uniref:hypothetical protein n=1 Tax=Plantibacter sp. YIM 135347 TaxID=3423919 RepID=UPI003D33C4C3
MTPEPAAPTRRLELTLRKPWLGWFPRPTIVFDGRGHPAQWGTGTWQIAADGATTIEVFLYNRLWRFGEASSTVPAGADAPTPLAYRAPWLPFGRGRIGAAP